jgi:hypothetical protein
MAEFTLPKNSKVQKGKKYPAKAGAKNVRTFTSTAGTRTIRKIRTSTNTKSTWRPAGQWFSTR